jgi:hypothetical protein
MVLFVLILFPAILFAHSISLNTQHVALRRQHDSGWQHDVLARAVVSRKFDVGLQATYLERFQSYDRRAGAFVIYHPSSDLTLEARYVKGDDQNIILPQNEYNLTAYYAAAPGLTPFLIYRNVDYSATRLNTAHLGLEIEKIANIILIPHVMFGKASFKSPRQTSDVYNYGLRAMYYREKDFSLFVFGSKGQEASQGIIGVSNLLINTLTGGAGAGYFFTQDLKGELTIDHTNYKEIRNQFVTTNVNLQWMF